MTKIPTDDDDFERTVGWDGRQLYVKELAHRLHLLLDSSPSDLKEWLENLWDLYDLAYPAINSEDYLTELQQITELVYEKDDIRSRTEAQLLMRNLGRKIHSRLWSNGLWMPLKTKEDPGKAIAHM